MDSEEVRRDTNGKLKGLEGKPAEFCVEKIIPSKILECVCQLGHSQFPSKLLGRPDSE